MFGSDDLHFDHTSILKTIARRFLARTRRIWAPVRGGQRPLGGRGEQKRQTQFRPFIQYNLIRRLADDARRQGHEPGTRRRAVAAGQRRLGSAGLLLRRGRPGLLVYPQPGQQPVRHGPKPSRPRDPRRPCSRTSGTPPGPASRRGIAPSCSAGSSPRQPSTSSSGATTSSPARRTPTSSPSRPTRPCRDRPSSSAHPQPAGPPGHGHTNWKVTSQLLPDQAGNQQ